VRPGDGFHKPLALTCHVCGRDFGTTSLEIHVKQCLEKRVAKQLRVRKALTVCIHLNTHVTLACACLHCNQLPENCRTDAAPAPDLPIPVERDYETREEFQACVAVLPALVYAPSHLCPWCDGCWHGCSAIDEYNAAAMAQYRSCMATCQCGRRFEPESLIVHQRSCGDARAAGGGVVNRSKALSPMKKVNLARTLAHAVRYYNATVCGDANTMVHGCVFDLLPPSRARRNAGPVV